MANVKLYAPAESQQVFDMDGVKYALASDNSISVPPHAVGGLLQRGFVVGDTALANALASIGLSRSNVVGVQSSTTKKIAIFDGMSRVAARFPHLTINPLNTYVGTDTTTGSYARRVVEYKGDIVGTPTSRACTDHALLKNTSGASLLTALDSGGAGGLILHGIWLLHDGSVFFVMHLENADTAFAYVTNAARTSVSGPAGANCAVMDIGTKGGTQYAGVRMFTDASFCEIYDNRTGTYTLLFAEYNVAAGRSKNSANDFARVMKSTDAGQTWSVLLEFNDAGGSGNHVINHFHGVRQDPYTGNVYFMTGDATGERYIIGWDGTSSPPAANSSIATLAATAGWTVTIDTELCRITDILFAPTYNYSLPDSDSESNDTTSIANNIMLYDKSCAWISKLGRIDGRKDNIPPAVGCRTPDGLSFILSFRTGAFADSADNNLYLWGSADSGQTWRLIAKLATGTPTSRTAVPSNCWFDSVTGLLIISGLYGRSVDFGAGSNSGTTSLISVLRSATPMVQLS